jgi:hypothetical protein
MEIEMRKIKDLFWAVGISLLACWAMESAMNYEPTQPEALQLTVNVGSLPPLLYREMN